MKKLTSFSLAAAALLLASCTSESNVPDQPALNGDTFMALNISVASNGTRAEGDDNSGTTPTNGVVGELTGTQDESTLSTVTLYIFNNGIYEATETLNLPGDNNKIIATKRGEKTIFAITGPSSVSFTDATLEGVNIENFEKKTFASMVNNMTNRNNFTMIGKSATRLIEECETNDIPETNKFSIEVVRATAKLTFSFITDESKGTPCVINPAIDATFSGAQFGARQNAKQMYVKYHAGLTPSGVANNASTYSNYDMGTNYLTAWDSAWPAINPNPSSDYDAVKVQWDYMTENWHGTATDPKPVTGNTTFASIKFNVTPNKVYTCATPEEGETATLVEGNLASDKTFYAIARRNTWEGTVAYAYDKDGKTLYFADQNSAQNYAAALNKEYELEAPEEGSHATGIYESVKFDGGVVYYRVNIQSETDGSLPQQTRYRIDRNYYYQINIDEITTLGQETEIVPGNPDQPLEGDASILCTFSVKPWTVFRNGIKL